MRENEFEFIRGLVYEHSRINLGPDKRELVSARLGKRLRATNQTTVGEYCKFLRSQNDGDELAHLIDAISTNHTFFFREIAHFNFLSTTVVPEMKARLPAEEWSHFRVWSAACSSGEEPYSIAMSLEETSDGTWPWQIEATDISHHVLEKAAAGIYRGETVEKLDPQRIRRHFRRGYGPQEGNYRIKPALQSTINFQRLNLLSGEFPFPGLFHLIFCRNVMIYFDRKTQEELIAKLSRRIVPGGYLFVGHSESLAGIRHSLQTVRPAIYRRPLQP
jgi:chemotaxis protein methyltransferase CheR